MKHIIPILMALVIGGCLAGAALADDKAATGSPEFDRICDAYGPGYHRVPGTDTCLRVGGYVQLDATYSSGSSGGTASPLVKSGQGNR